MKLPQLSLRDLFGFLFVAAVLCGWLTSELQWRNYAARTAAQRQSAKEELERTQYELMTARALLTNELRKNNP